MAVNYKIFIRKGNKEQQISSWKTKALAEDAAERTLTHYEQTGKNSGADIIVKEVTTKITRKIISTRYIV